MAVAETVRKKYIPTIGIETHVQLKTKTKLFSAVSNDARSAEPNTLISHIDTGMPGALPVLNEAAIALACRAGLALNAQLQAFSKFDRKHYFYPDLPKGYQITQFEDPIIKGGYVEININGKKKKIDITRVHLEEDAGKNTHPESADYSLVDLNRAGTPLLEIVSEPQLHSPGEAKAFARELYLLMKYADVSNVDLYHGNMRFDVNISVSADPNKMSKRAEIKNLNSFRSVENAIAYEISRQIDIYEKDGEVRQETRGWDEAKQKTLDQRGKEEAHDYRYMPEPDIPPVELSEECLSKIKAGMPELPSSIREKLNMLSIADGVIEDILDNYEACTKLLKAVQTGAASENAARVAFDSLEKPETLRIPVAEHLKIAEAFNSKKLSSTAASSVLASLSANPGQNVEEVLSSHAQVSDVEEIEKIVAGVLAQNPGAAEDIRGGETKAIGFLVGQVMSKSQGKANPQLATQIIKRKLGLQ